MELLDVLSEEISSITMTSYTVEIPVAYWKACLEEHFGHGLTSLLLHCSKSSWLKLKSELTKIQLKKYNKTNNGFLNFSYNLNPMIKNNANNKIRRILLLESIGPLSWLLLTLQVMNCYSWIYLLPLDITSN